jgi:hypothetical protein
MSKEGEPSKKYKDTTFRLLFSEPERAVELYNAISGENLPPDTELVYTTLENALYIDRKNDLGFVINNRHLVLVECQSTVNMNIPLRCLGYVSRTLENLVGEKNLYGSKLLKFPAPEFYVFYVGSANWNVKHLRLSDAFLENPRENSVEIIVNLVNLNYNVDTEILKRSPTLLGYSKLLCYIREELASNGGDLKAAIDCAVKQCIDGGFIVDFLRNHSREVTGMLFEEISTEEFAEIRAKEAYEMGEQSGFTKGEQAGIEKGKQSVIEKMRASGMSEEQIAQILE